MGGADGTCREMASHRRTFVAGTFALGIVGCAKVRTTSVEPSDGVVTLVLSEHPRLAHQGAYIELNVAGVERPLVVFHRPGARYGATSRTCTHWGCSVKYDGTSDQLVCPCHGSRFGVDGSNIKGPAKRPLAVFDVAVDDGLLTIDIDSGASP